MTQLNQLIQNRFSPRAFDARPVEQEKVDAMFEAARWAPSCYNEQPWRFIYAHKHDEKDFNLLLNCLGEFNQRWVKGSPLLILSIAKLNFDRNGKPNRHAGHDLGLATENLVIQAMHDGLFSHQMAGFDIEKNRETFKISSEYDPLAFIAVGYLGDNEKLDEDLRIPKERIRKNLSEIVFEGEWRE